MNYTEMILAVDSLSLKYTESKLKMKLRFDEVIISDLDGYLMSFNTIEEHASMIYSIKDYGVYSELIPILQEYMRTPIENRGLIKRHFITAHIGGMHQVVTFDGYVSNDRSKVGIKLIPALHIKGTPDVDYGKVPKVNHLAISDDELSNLKSFDLGYRIELNKTILVPF